MANKLTFLFILGFLFLIQYGCGLVLGASLLNPLLKNIVLYGGFLGLTSSLVAIFFDLPKFHRFFKFSDWMGYTYFGVFLFEFTIVILLLIYRSLGAPFGESQSLPFIVLFLMTIFSLWKGHQHPKVTQHEKRIELRKEKDMEPTTVKVVQLSDVHIGMLHLRKKWLQQVIDQVNKEQPDVIVITGDLIESRLHEIEDDLIPLKDAKAKYGRYYITGNHEYYYGGEIWERKMEAFGWTVLHSNSELITVNDLKILISGIPDRTGFSMSPPAQRDFKAAVFHELEVDYKILLMHQPSDLKKISDDHKPHLLLTGHTHGGQIFPFHFLVRMLQPVVSGWKKINDMDLFVHQGTGFWGPPMRFGTESEIAVISLIFNARN